MAKTSKLQKEIARREAEIATLQAVLDALQDVQTATVKLKPPKARNVRRPAREPNPVAAVIAGNSPE